MVSSAKAKAEFKEAINQIKDVENLDKVLIGVAGGLSYYFLQKGLTKAFEKIGEKNE